MLIYISHPYANKPENLKETEEICIKLMKEYPNDTIISPIHCFGFAYSEVSYEHGLQMCLDLLSKCDKMLVFGDFKNSRGCTAEVLYCGMNFIPYEIMEGINGQV